jgi:hypothetical protein
MMLITLRDSIEGFAQKARKQRRSAAGQFELFTDKRLSDA